MMEIELDHHRWFVLATMAAANYAIMSSIGIVTAKNVISFGHMTNFAGKKRHMTISAETHFFSEDHE